MDEHISEAYYVDDETGLEWKVSRLWEESKKYPTSIMAMDKLVHNLNVPQWGESLSPMEVLIHLTRILQADHTYPILVFKDKGKYRVCDGIHRLCGHYIMGVKEFQVKIIKLPVPDNFNKTGD